MARKARGPTQASLTSSARGLGFPCEFIVVGIRRAWFAWDAPLFGFQPAEMTLQAGGVVLRTRMVSVGLGVS